MERKGKGRWLVRKGRVYGGGCRLNGTTARDRQREKEEGPGSMGKTKMEVVRAGRTEKIEAED
jgi:hypothetical protein